MRSGSFSRYYNVYSIIHSMNPLCKILGFWIFIIMVVMGSNIRVMCCLSLILLFIIALSNVSLFNYIRPIYCMRLLFVFIFIINILFGVSVYSSFIMICRICLVIMYSSVLLFTTTTNEIAYGFSSLLRPFSFFGIPVTRVSMAIALFFNFVPSLFFEYNRIIKSQTSRGFNDCSFLDRVKLIFSTFICSIRRTYCTSDVIKVKNFDSDRSCIKSSRWGVSDFYMIASHVMVFVFVLVKEVVM